MDTQESTLQTIARHLVLALEPLKAGVADLPAFRTLLYRLGWDVQSLPPEYTALAAKVDQALAALDGLGDDPTPTQIFDVLDEVSALYTALKGITNAPDGVDASEFLAEFGQSLFELLLADYLNEVLPSVHSALLGLDIITQRFVEETDSRPGVLLTRFQWEEIPRVLTDPGSIPARVYGWGTDDVDFHRLAGHLLEFFVSRDWPAYIGRVDQELGEGFKDLPDDPVTSIDWALKIPVLLDNIGGEEIEVGLALLELPAQGSKPAGLILQPLVPPAIGTHFDLSDELRLELRSGSDVSTTFGVLLRPGDLSVKFPLQEGADLPEAGFGVTLRYAPQSPALLLGTPGKSRLELKGATSSFNLDFRNGQFELRFDAAPQDLKLVIAATDLDGFLGELLSGQDVTLPIPLIVRWSNETGIAFVGGSGFQVSLPGHLSLGPVALQQIQLAVGATQAPGRAPDLSVEAAASLGGQLGPLAFSVDGIGLRLVTRFTDGNAGPFDIDLGFKPPDGLGLSIDGGGFTGGGFLRYFEADQRYEGMLELEYEDRISLKAIGLLTTRLPGGRPGFSLLIIITSEFTPIQLGLGFTLNGVGGLLGLNRTADAERLRSGLRDNTLSSVLFPQNVVQNAARILSDLNQLFPVQPDRFIFGPMARIGWGSPTLITIDVGLLIEIPEPVRVLILGVIRALLPDEKARLLQLQVNFLGVIDLQAQRLAFDASLYDSRLLSFALSGDMAVRLSWGAEPNFLLTAGGFHPAYEPPPLNLPVLRRLSLQLTSGDNPRLTLESYYAITSNTYQFGARVELLAKAGSFSVYGFLSFDVLFQFNPFYFIAAISAKLALRAGSSEIASISLDFTLEGPTPWHVKGTAKLKICWFLTVKVSFDKTFGEPLTTLLPDILVLPLLRAALSDPGNWEAQPAVGRRLLVTLKAIEGSGEVVVAPFGVLTIQQRVAPLGIAIQRFGSQRPADGSEFAIKDVTAGEEGAVEEPLDTRPVSEQFAPAQFFDMTDAEKLSSKSFERYQSGVQVVDSEGFSGEYAVQRGVTYELSYIDAQRDRPPPKGSVRPDFLAFHSWALRGAVARSPLSQARNGQSALAPAAVQVSQEGFAVVRASDLRVVAVGAQAASEAGAQRLMEGLVRDNPALESEILVVPAFEVNQS